MMKEKTAHKPNQRMKNIDIKEERKEKIKKKKWWRINSTWAKPENEKYKYKRRKKGEKEKKEKAKQQM